MDNSNVNTSAPVSVQGGTKKNLSALTIIFAITTLGFGGAFAWAMLRDNGGISADKGGNSNTCAVTQEEVEKAEEGTVGEIVANYDTDKEVKDLVKDMIKSYDSLERQYSVAMTVDTGAVVTKLESGVLTTTTKSYGVTATPYGDYLVDYSNATKEFLASRGFSQNAEFSGDNNLVYDKGDIRCSFSEGVGPSFSAVCSNIKWVSAESAELATAMYNAYVAKNGSADAMYVFVGDKSKIQTSNSGKYERLQASIYRANTGIGAVYALYYREVGATEWTFVLAGNGIPQCSSFDEVATEAFTGSGFGCADSDNNIKSVGE